MAEFFQDEVGSTNFTELEDTPSSYTGQGGKAVFVKQTEDGLELQDVAEPAVTINDLTDVDTTGKSAGRILEFDGSGNMIVGDKSSTASTSFTSLTDTPSDYVGQAGNVATVNQTEDGIIFSTVEGGGLVDSVFGRIGAVAAQAGDYDSDLITNKSTIKGSSVTAVLNTVNNNFTTVNNELDDKIDKVTTGVTNNLLIRDSVGNAADSGIPFTTIPNKVDKIAGGTTGALVSQGSSGSLEDTGINPNFLSGRLTTQSLIFNSTEFDTGDVVVTGGFTSLGDGGAGTWKATSTVGLTPNQSPSTRSSAELVDSTGRLWEWAEKELPLEALGAVGDGVTDNLGAFNAAVGWSTATQGKCTLGSGVFLVSDEILTIGGYLHIKGFSREATTIKQSASGNSNVIAVTSNGFLIVESLTLDHNSTGNGKTAGHGIRSGGHNLLIAKDIKITDTTGYGIGLQQGTMRETYITDFEINGTGFDGIDIKDRNFNNECVFISNGLIADWSRSDNDDSGIDARGEVVVNNIKLVAGSTCIGVRLRKGTPEAGRSGFGHYSNIIIDGQNFSGTVAIALESDDRGATYNNITVKDATFPWVQFLGSVGGTINNITATGTEVSVMNGTDLSVNGCSIENVSSASRMFDFTSTAANNRITNVNLKNNASTGELARHQAGADNNQIVGGFSNTTAVNQLGTNWFLEVNQKESGAAPAALKDKNIERPPSRSDAFSVSDSRIWQYREKLWVATRVTSGVRASWTRIPRTADSVFDSAGGCVGAFYTFKVNPTYTGPCLRIENEGNGGEFDVGFNSDGLLDLDAMNKLLGGQRGRVAVWYNQDGSGNNVTATGSARPVVNVYPDENGVVSVVFETDIVTGFSSTVQQSMNLPTGISENSSSLSIATYGKFASSVRGAPLVQVGSGSNATSVGVSIQNGVDSVAVYQNGNRRIISNYSPSTDDNFIMATYGGTQVKVFFNDEEAASVTGTAVGAASISGGKIGGDLDFFIDGNSNPVYGGAMLKGFSIYNREVTTGEVRDVYRSLCTQLDLLPQRRGRIVFDGDSIVEGDGAEYFYNWPRVCTELMTNKHQDFQVARSGGTSTTQSSAFSDWSTNIYRSYEPYNLIVLAVGTNDIGSGSSSSALIASVENYITAANSAGYEVVLATVLPRSSFIGNSRETVRQDYNTYLRESFSDMGAIGIIDWDLEGTMGDVNKVSNTDFYQDGTHPTTYGYSLLGTYAAERVDEIIDSTF